jgi:sulfite exporter TauE/SafE
MLEPDIIAMFFMGLMSSAHCIGMCGGIASALSLSSQNKAPTPVNSLLQTLTPLFFYNLGRLFSYALIGGLLSGLVATLADLSHVTHQLGILRFIAALLLLLVALHIGKLWQGIGFIEKGGKHIWAVISPLAIVFMPLKRKVHALPLGMIWGWLPCGMVYSALSIAAVTANSLSGTLTMLAFGFGTLPAMLLVGGTAEKIKLKLNNLKIRRFFAFVIFTYAIFSIYITWRYI